MKNHFIFFYIWYNNIMKENNFYFVKNVEKMISPNEVGNLQFLQNFSKLTSKKKQLKSLEKSSKTTPFMSFVVEPYSTFLCFEITDLNWAQSLLPDDFKLTKTKIFSNDKESKYYCIIGVFNVHTSVFWGSRLEFNIIATKKSTNMLSWVIVDFDSNTINHSNKFGLRPFTTQHFINTTDFNANIIVDVKSINNLSFDMNIKTSHLEHLDQKLWLDGNFSVGYGKEISQNSNQTFSMIFDEREAKEAFSISQKNVHIHENSWFKGLFKEVPEFVVCFPYAQHFLSDSPGHDSEITTTQQMNKLYQNLNFDKIEKYSPQKIMKKMKIGMIFSTIITILLAITTIVLLILK